MIKMNLSHHPDDIKRYHKGECIFSEGEHAEFMCDVVSGEIELTQSGRLLAQLATGEIFGEIAVINDAKHSVTATAVSDCEIAQINRRRFLFMIEETPNFALKIIQVLAERLQHETKNHSK